MAQKRSNYQCIDGFSPAPMEPPQWETFLNKLNLTEIEAFRMIQGRSEASNHIRNWVHTHYRLVFVPELFLKTIGIEMGFDD